MSYANHVEMHVALDSISYLTAQGLGGQELLTLVVLARHAGQNDRSCWVGLDTIAAKTGCSRSTVQRSVRNLVRVGLLNVAQKRGKTHVYRLCTPGQADTRVEQAPVSQGPGGQVSLTPHPGQPDTPTQVSLTPLPRSVGPDTQVSLTPEVVKELEKRSNEGEVENRTSTPAIGREDRSPSRLSSWSGRKTAAGPAVPKTLTTRSQHPATTTAVQTAPQPTPPASSEARLLAGLYLAKLGGDRNLYGTAADRDWPVIFDQLLPRFGADLAPAIEWAFIDEFWNGEDAKLFRRSGCPVAWFATKAATIVEQYLRSKPVPKSTSAGQHPATTKKPSPLAQLARACQE